MAKTYGKSNKIQFIPLSADGFFASKEPYAYAKVWFDPVDEYVYLVKDTFNKDQFPLNDCAIYQQHEAEYFQEALDGLPDEVGKEHVRKLHFVIKLFSGTLSKERFDDPDPTKSHKADSKYWRRLYYYARYTDRAEGFSESVKTLREKGFRIVKTDEGNKLKMLKPENIDDIEKQHILKKYIGPFNFREAFESIEDYTEETQKRISERGIL